MKKYFEDVTHKKIVSLLGLMCLLAAAAIFSHTFSSIRTANASTGVLTGYAWSDMPDGSDQNKATGSVGRGAGWISFSCANENVCSTSPYGISVDNSGNLSGKAWSETVGWISFDSTDVIGCPSGTCQPIINQTTGVVSGWARALAYASTTKTITTVTTTTLPTHKEYTLSLTTQKNVNINTLARALGWDATSTLNVIVLPGAIIGSNSSASAALDTTGLPTGITYTLTNNGYIQGAGGAGASSDVKIANGPAGNPGGTALKVTVPITVDNTNGYIYGGGGGGGAGSGCMAYECYDDPPGPGGGGAGYAPGAAGTLATHNGNIGPATAGSTYGGGTGGTVCTNNGASDECGWSGNGGNGGGPGQAGSAGSNSGYGTGGAGGAAGAAVVGSSYINWVDQGSITGAVSAARSNSLAFATAKTKETSSDLPRSIANAVKEAVGPIPTARANITLPLGVSMTAFPSTVPSGTASTLSYFSISATSCSIDQGIGSVSTSGTTIVSPTVTKTYTISCTDGTSVATATSTVTIASNSLTSANISAGTVTSTSTATVSVNNAGGWDGWIHLSGLNYGVQATNCSWGGYAWGGNVLGWIHFKGTNYGVTGTGSGCSGNTVTATLTATPNLLTAAGPTTLAWGSTNAITCVGSNFSTNNATSGSVTATVSQTTIYGVTCTGATGSTRANALVTLSPLGSSERQNGTSNGITATSSLNLRANPSSLRPNTATVLTWSVANVNTSTCTLAQPSSAWSISLLNGTNDSGIVTSPAITQATKFTLSCTGNDGLAKSVTITVGLIPKLQEI